MHDLIDELNRLGIHIAWTDHLPLPGIFVAEYDLLVLNADEDAAALTAACADVLAAADQRAVR